MPLFEFNGRLHTHSVVAYNNNCLQLCILFTTLFEQGPYRIARCADSVVFFFQIVLYTFSTRAMEQDSANVILTQITDRFIINRRKNIFHNLFAPFLNFGSGSKN